MHWVLRRTRSQNEIEVDPKQLISSASSTDVWPMLSFHCTIESRGRTLNWTYHFANYFKSSSTFKFSNCVLKQQRWYGLRRLRKCQLTLEEYAIRGMQSASCALKSRRILYILFSLGSYKDFSNVLNWQPDRLDGYTRQHWTLAFWVRCLGHASIDGL